MFCNSQKNLKSKTKLSSSELAWVSRFLMVYRFKIVTQSCISLNILIETHIMTALNAIAYESEFSITRSKLII